MTFVSLLALAIALLVAAPFAAHRLRRRQAEEQPFPPARLVTSAPPKARRRSRVEDRALLATRAAGVVALALLGATPFVRCSRLSLSRSEGASIALAVVVDDSMSMRALAGARPRFEAARQGALELLSTAREGDAVAVVLAGAPARVALAPTTDLAAAGQAVRGLVQSDRGTDLEGALSLAQGIISALPQPDRRIVLLSDLADGHPDAPPLGQGSPIPVWAALAPSASEPGDCALVRAEQRGVRVQVAVACGPGHSPAGREIVVEDAKGNALGRASATGAPSGDVSILLGPGNARPDRAHLTGADAIAVDDVAWVRPEETRGAVAVVVDDADESVATGGAPVVEQALGALKLEVDVTPLPAFPDRTEDLGAPIGVLLDDPAGLTPEQRRALSSYLNRGGVVLLALGPRAASAPLGASLQPILTRAVSYIESRASGADAASARGGLAESAASLVDLSAPRRAVLATEDAAAFTPMISWSDGAPLVGRRTVGRGEAWIVTLPFSVDASDLPLRPAFLALLAEWVRSAQNRAAPLRSPPGVTWTFPSASHVEIEGPAGPLPVTVVDEVERAVPALLGRYQLKIDDDREARVLAPDPLECDLRPRGVSASASRDAHGQRSAAIDISGGVALALLALITLEMILRLASRPRPRGSDSRMLTFASVLVLSAGLAGALSCGGPDRAARYVETRDEHAAVAGARPFPPAPLDRDPARSPRSPVVLAGVVEERQAGPGGQARLRLSVRGLCRDNFCERGGGPSACRVTASRRAEGFVWVLVSLTGEDDLGPGAVRQGSLVRVVGSVGQDIGPRGGASVIRATWYRHFSPSEYSQAQDGCSGPLAGAH